MGKTPQVTTSETVLRVETEIFLFTHLEKDTKLKRYFALVGNLS